MTSRTQTQTRSGGVVAVDPAAASVAAAPSPAYAPHATSPTNRGKGFSASTPPNPKMKQYTWEEVAQHNTAASAWVYIGNAVYDITPWLNRHPGGADILLLTAGRDISDLFVTYHPFSDTAAKTIEQFRIGEVATTEFPQFKPDTGFYRECRQKVGQYFKANKLDHKDPRAGMLRLAAFIVGAMLTYTVMLQRTGVMSGWAVQLVAAVLFGVFQALPLLHTMHDASHLAIGSTPAWWRYTGRLCMDWFAGASLYSWYNQHTIGHHVYTNIMGADPDLPVAESGDIRRIAPFQKWTAFYKWQHLYLMLLYGVLGMKFRIQDITDTIIAGTNGAIRVNNQSSTDLMLQLLSKSFWFTYRIALPIYYFGVPHAAFWPTFFIAEMMTGYYLAFNFQVSHVSPDALWPDITRPMSDEWAVNQVATSIDYAHGDPIVALLSGALNYQTVHHLFPSVSQYHYPAIAPIVMAVCDKYAVKYNRLDSFASAFAAHVAYLKQMGEQGVTLHIHDM